MSKRRGLNDDIHGDRAAIRGGQVAKEFDWDDFDKNGYGGPDPLDTGLKASSTVTSGKFDSYAKNFNDDDWRKRTGQGSKSHYGHGRCYEKHPPLTLPGTDFKIYGGSCSNPVVLDADVYIGFDGSMRWTERHYPWKKGTEVLFRITDYRAPDKPEEFKKLVSWTKKQIEAGLKVHCGCIGGHGRTGTFLAALVSEFGETDAIQYVRKNYCPKAVESSEQVKFLVEHFSVKPADGAKANNWGGSYSKSSSSGGSKGSKGSSAKLYTPIANGIW